MKIWAFILASGAMAIQSLPAGESFRTDINPALRASAATTSYTDSPPPAQSRRFYRIRTQP